MSPDFVLDRAMRLMRRHLDRAFNPDTAAPGTPGGAPSAGHCAAVASIVQSIFGGEMVSATVMGQSHWFNRVTVGAESFDVDLTGDQFGLPEVRIDEADGLHPGTRVRSHDDLKQETRDRARRLYERMGIGWL